MKKLFLLPLAVVSLVSFTVIAHGEDYNEGLKAELNQDIDQMYPKRPRKNKVIKLARHDDDEVRVETRSVTTSPVVQPAPVVVQQQQQQQPVQPIYILQQPASLPGPAQMQPTTTVEAASIRESKSEVLRKQREEMERQTEDKLTQRLEDDRIMSEKERADRLLAPLTPPAAATPAAAVVQQQQQAVVAPSTTPVVVQQQQQAVVTPAVTPVVETTPVVSAKVQETPVEPVDERSQFRVGGLAGMGSYPTVSNVSGIYALGATGDLKFADRMGIQASFLFSSFDVKNSTPCYYCYNGTNLVTTMTQYNVNGGFTYDILGGRVSPVIGALVGYTRRTYAQRVSYGYGNNDAISGSNAFDGGLLVGVDVSATKKLSVGADLRYMWNLSYRTDDAMAYSYGPQVGSPIESLNYYFATLNLKLAL